MRDRHFVDIIVDVVERGLAKRDAGSGNDHFANSRDDFISLLLPGTGQVVLGYFVEIAKSFLVIHDVHSLVRYSVPREECVDSRFGCVTRIGKAASDLSALRIRQQRFTARPNLVKEVRSDDLADIFRQVSGGLNSQLER